ncbi:uncharacterized protein LOC144733093 isoform X2 [Lampetra planeri]
MVPMVAVVVAVVAVVVVSVPSAATATVAMMQTTKAGEWCPHGFYRATSGAFCCQQCQAGDYLISDCTAEQGHSGCQVCADGTYTELPNSSPKCFTCTPCQPDEEEERQCSATTDRRCRCKPGYHQPGGDIFCRKDSVPPVTSSTTGPPDSGGSNTVAIAVAVVLLLLIGAAAAAFIYKKKGGKFPCDSIEVKFIKDNRAEIIRHVCDDPGSLLDEVESLGYKNVYSTAIAQKKECRGESLIDEMISLGQKACQDLIRALEAVQDKYEGLQQLLDMINDSGSAGRLLDRKPSASESGADQRKSPTTTHPDGPDGDQRGAADPNGHRLNDNEYFVTPTSGRRQDDSGSAGRLLDGKPSASESDADQRESQTTTQPDGPDGNQRGAADPNGHRLNYNEYVEVRDMDESMAAKLIRGKRPQLKQWIGRDPTYLLDYLDSRDLISRNKYDGARDITLKVERANFLIDEFIDRDECLIFWRALESLQEDYPQLTKWISACASSIHHACVRDMDESNAAKLIKGKMPELKKWIGRDPTYLLDYLDSRDLISRDIYKRARDITVKEERANFLIDEFIDRDEFLKLWRALESLQDHYPQLKEWISACASTTHHACEKAPGLDANIQYSTAPAGEVAANEKAFRRLTACSDEQLLDGIMKNMTALVEAIQGDVQPLLTKLFEMEIFTLAEMNAVSTTQKNNGGFEAASQLITKLLHKGDRVAREFWMALWNLKTNYLRMHKIFENGL